MTSVDVTSTILTVYGTRFVTIFPVKSLPATTFDEKIQMYHLCITFAIASYKSIVQFLVLKTKDKKKLQSR